MSIYSSCTFSGEVTLPFSLDGSELLKQKSAPLADLQIRGSIEVNSKIIFLISQ